MSTSFVSASGSSGNRLVALLVRELFPHDYQEQAQYFSEFGRHFLDSVLLPLLVSLLAAAVAWKVWKGIYRILHPKSCRELYTDALILLHSNAPTMRPEHPSRSYQRTLRRVERLLARAMQKRPDWKPVLHAMAALYVYRFQAPNKALQVIRHGGHSESCDGCRQLRLDAMALSSRQGSEMVLHELGEDEFLSLRAGKVNAMYY